MSPTSARGPALVLAAEPALWLDLVGLAFVLLFVVLGLRGGLWWQLVRLVGLVATVAVARALGPRLGAALESAFAGLDPRVATGLGWTLVLFAGFLVVALVGRIGQVAGGAPQELGVVDRAGGALAGGLAGLVLHAALLLCAAQFASPEWSEARIRGSRSQTLMATLERGIPGLIEVHAAESLGLPPPR